MALDNSKSGFGFDMEERVNRKNKQHKHNDTPTHNHEHNHTHGIQEPQAKERKTKRVQLLTYESLIARMDAYAAKQGVGRVDVFEAAVSAFLDSVEKNEV